MGNVFTDPILIGPEGLLSIRDALVLAHRIPHVYANSIQETFSVHRFLAAILQDIHRPLELSDILHIINQRMFPPALIDGWIQRHPIDPEDFLQVPNLIGHAKTVGYLTSDIPVGSNSIHFRHSMLDEGKMFCPRCCTLGLINVAAWQQIGGQGLQASLNGAPPLYVLPEGKSLFETLALSLIVHDLSIGVGAWERPIKKAEINDPLGYLDGLTFMPRQVKIFYDHISGVCSRCGEPSDTLAEEMYFSSGEKYKGTAWRDPYAGYKPAKDKKSITPIRAFGSRGDWQAFCGGILTGEYLPQVMRQWPNHKIWRVFGTVSDQAKILESFMVVVDLDKIPVAPPEPAVEKAPEPVVEAVA